MLQDKIFNDLRDTRDNATKDSLKVIVGELQRQRKKVLSDIQVIDTLRILIGFEETRLAKCLDKTSKYLEILYTYLPIQTTDEEIISFIKENFETIPKDTGPLVGKTKKYFGAAKVTGDRILKVLEDYF